MAGGRRDAAVSRGLLGASSLAGLAGCRRIGGDQYQRKTAPHRTARGSGGRARRDAARQDSRWLGRPGAGRRAHRAPAGPRLPGIGNGNTRICEMGLRKGRRIIRDRRPRTHVHRLRAGGERGGRSSRARKRIARKLQQVRATAGPRLGGEEKGFHSHGCGSVLQQRAELQFALCFHRAMQGGGGADSRPLKWQILTSEPCSSDTPREGATRRRLQALRAVAFPSCTPHARYHGLGEVISARSSQELPRWVPGSVLPQQCFRAAARLPRGSRARPPCPATFQNLRNSARSVPPPSRSREAHGGDPMRLSRVPTAAISRRGGPTSVPQVRTLGTQKPGRAPGAAAARAHCASLCSPRALTGPGGAVLATLAGRPDTHGCGRACPARVRRYRSARMRLGIVFLGP